MVLGIDLIDLIVFLIILIDCLFIDCLHLLMIASYDEGLSGDI